jgi:hypothetical protein
MEIRLRFLFLVRESEAPNLAEAGKNLLNIWNASERGVIE